MHGQIAVIDHLQTDDRLFVCQEPDVPARSDTTFRRTYADPFYSLKVTLRSFPYCFAGVVSVPPAKRVACWVGPSQRRLVSVKTSPPDPPPLVLGCTASRSPIRSRPSIRHSLAPRSARP